MPIEGFVALQHKGRYAIYHPGGIYHELNKDDRLDVDTGDHWLEMKVGHDFEGYFLESKEISFYPKMVYAIFEFRRHRLLSH